MDNTLNITSESDPNLLLGVNAAFRRDYLLSAPTLLAHANSLDSLLAYRDKVLVNRSVLSLQASCSESGTGSSTPSTTHFPKEPIITITPIRTKQFRSTIAEYAFIMSMAIAQLLGEYLISGFSVIQPTILAHYGITSKVDFWPASLLSLCQCATILVFARLSDRYGGYSVYMGGVAWLAIWSCVAGFAPSLEVLEVARAFQGVGIAAFTPACLTLFGSVYPNGPRKNLMLGIFGACAPIGFFAGIFASSALPDDQWSWYFHISAIAALAILLLAYLSVPFDTVDRTSNKLGMDWLGAFTITPGLILVVYALSASTNDSNSWTSIAVLLPFILGLACLGCAIWIEGWVASSPLIPAAFFWPRGITLFLVACVLFFSCFGIWLFSATQFLDIEFNVRGTQLALWFLPMAIGGLVIAITGSALVHIVPLKILMLVSGLAWLGAPLLLALADPKKSYWQEVFPAMICATLGIDLTFTLLVVFLAASQPSEYQGLAGAVSSLIVNLAIALSLACVQILEQKTGHSGASTSTNTSGQEQADIRSSRMAFWLALGCAAAGLVIVPFVHISRSTVSGEHKRCIVTEEGRAETMMAEA